MRRGFADHEFLFPFMILTFALVLCLPILQLMRSSRLSPVMGITIIAGVCLVVIGPWVYSEHASRRRLKQLMDLDEEPKDAE